MAEQLDDDFQTAFWNAKRTMVEASEAAFRRYGVRAGQQHILRVLWRQDCQSPGQIARRLGLATPTVTKMTSRMEAAGIVERRPHATDRRLVRVCLTQRGVELQAVIDQEMRAMTESALRTLGPHERRQLVRFLHEVHQNLASYPALTAAPGASDTALQPVKPDGGGQAWNNGSVS
ncbi:MAG TPA: MarR family transcriptional regulator [Candidatus Dormibacteraeota bacterium]|nr:MarR family transcriptional regulator [Candidatus Dormibacteraeota bacterium]